MPGARNSLLLLLKASVILLSCQLTAVTSRTLLELIPGTEEWVLQRQQQQQQKLLPGTEEWAVQRQQQQGQVPGTEEGPQQSDQGEKPAGHDGEDKLHHEGEQQQQDLIPGTEEWSLQVRQWQQQQQQGHQQQQQQQQQQQGLIPGTQEWALQRQQQQPHQNEQQQPLKDEKQRWQEVEALRQEEEQQPQTEQQQQEQLQLERQKVHPWKTEQQEQPAPIRDPKLVLVGNMQCNTSDFAGLSYCGYECHAANIWPDGPCPVAGSCLPACSRCMNWRRGRLPLTAAPSARRADVPALGRATSSASGLTSEMTCDGTIWGFGLWRGEEWVAAEAYPQCSAERMSPAAIYGCLKGKRVALFGDSMIRPLAGRLVSYLRGVSQYIDHLYHAPGGYYMANGTHDVLVEDAFLPSLHARVKERYPKYNAPATPEDGWDPRVTLEMQLYWAPRFTRYELDGRTYPSLSEHLGVLDGSDVMIAGPMYHEAGEYDTFREHLLLYFQKLAHAGKRISHFFWVASIPFATDKADIYGERNRKMRTFVEMLNEHALYGNNAVPRRSYYVDAARMAGTAPVQRVDGHHYQCNKHGIFPAGLNADLVGMSEKGDCRDVFNLNVVQTILKVACARG